MILDYIVTPVKMYWLREEIPIAEDLLSYVPKLTEEFLTYHEDFIEGSFSKGKPYRNATFDTNKFQTRMDAWKAEGIKYTFEEANIYTDLSKKKADFFPTAIELTKKYNDHCSISSYSIIEANSSIVRHTGIENRSREYLRIHIPLIVPEGDIFFEVEGVEIDWSDIFGFDNQLIHSAHNNSPYRRLVYLIDVRRDFLGIPLGQSYDPIREKHIPPFVRGSLPKVLHSCQKEYGA